jgi:histidinol-phosphatase (PHP family)
MFVDYHVHIDKLEWSLNTVEQICKRAEEIGVDRVGIVVHTKALDGFQPLYEHVLSKDSDHKKLKFNRDIDSYFGLLTKAKRLGYPIDIGIEVCYSPQGEDFLKNKLALYPFDYKIGSVHLIDDKHYKTSIEHYKNRFVVGMLYYKLILKAIKCGMFNIVGHIEVARREGIPGLQCYPDILEEICDALIENNCTVEINTKWLVKHGDIIPDMETLQYMESKDVKLVFGSDAHHIERIGFEMENASSAICGAGYRGFSHLMKFE